MKMQKILLAACLLSAVNFLCPAAEEKTKTELPPSPETIRTDLKAGDFPDREEAEKLLGARSRLLEKMRAERILIIREDKEARELREELMKLHKRLAILVDSKPAMKALNAELRGIDAALMELSRKKDAGNSNSPSADAADSAGKTDAVKSE